MESVAVNTLAETKYYGHGLWKMCSTMEPVIL